MSILLKTHLQSNHAYSIKENLSNENFYMFLGKTTAWSNESSPDVPADTDSEAFTAASEIFAMKKLTSTNACLVVPRYDWVSGTVYDQYSSTDADLYTKQFYVINSNMNVYKCLNNNSGAQSVVMPTGQSVNNIQTGDGYIWKFLYNVSSSLQSSFLTDDYLPVPTNEQKSSLQLLVESNASYSSGSPLGGHGSNAYIELGSSKLMISGTFAGTESGIIDATSSYRKIGIIKNPKLVSTGAVATGSIYSVNDTNSDIDTTTGSILYMEHRIAIQRNVDQAENIKIVLQFS